MTDIKKKLLDLNGGELMILLFHSYMGENIPKSELDLLLYFHGFEEVEATGIRSLPNLLILS